MKREDALFGVYQKTIASLRNCDHKKIERWAYIYVLCQDGLKRSEDLDASQREVFGVVSAHALKQAMRILGVAYSDGWSAVGRRKTLERVERIMLALVAFSSPNPDYWQFDQNESVPANSPVGCGRKPYESGVWVSGIVL